MLLPFTYKIEVFQHTPATICRVWLHPTKFENTLDLLEETYLFEDVIAIQVQSSWHPHYLGGFLASRIACIKLWGFLPQKSTSHQLQVPGFSSLSHTKMGDVFLALVAKNPLGPVGIDIQSKSLSTERLTRALKRVGKEPSKRPWFDWCKREVQIKAPVQQMHLLFEDETRIELLGY